MRPDRPQTEFGNALRAARERRGVSLRQIANKTKISIGALEALERGDVSRLPGGIFGRAFVRSYAIEVGLDPEETIDRFLEQFPHDGVAAGHPRTDQIEDGEALESTRRMATTFLRLAAISIPLVGAVLYFGPGGHPLAPPRAPEPQSAPPPSSPAGVVPASREAPVPSAVPGDVSQPLAPAPVERAAVAADRLTVALAATGPCWVSATVDGQKAFERLMQAGEEQTLEVRRELVLTAGDAAAIGLRLNGAPARLLGKSGDVVTVHLNLSNYKDYLAVP